MKKKIFSTLVYLMMFVVIYGAVNWYRAPTLPNTANLTYANEHNQLIDVIAVSHQQPILVYFWGTWCSICSLTSPNIQALHANGQPVVSVAVKSDSTEALGRYMTMHGYDFIAINDLGGEIFHAWQGKVTPSFVILKDGKIHQSFTGIAPLWSLKLRLWAASLV